MGEKNLLGGDYALVGIPPVAVVFVPVHPLAGTIWWARAKKYASGFVDSTNTKRFEEGVERDWGY